jgi:cytochrome c oxidase cbb3-type subunit 1
MTHAAATTTHADVPTHDQLVDQKIVIAFFVAGLTYLTISMVAGILMALQLVHWNPLRGIELFSPGRWRMVHTNAIAYGFLANAFLGALNWAVPRLTFHPVASKALNWFIFVTWQVIVVSTAAALIVGPSLQDQKWIMDLAREWKLPMSLGAQGLEWGETPFWIDPVALLGLALVAINFMVPIAKSKGPMYVTLWYFMAAFVWTFLTYAMGNLLPEYTVGGTSAGAIGGPSSTTSSGSS